MEPPGPSQQEAEEKVPRQLGAENNCRTCLGSYQKPLDWGKNQTKAVGYNQTK